MNKQIIIKSEIIRIREDLLEIRGKEYTKLFIKFSELWAWYFNKQVDEYLLYVENNPQLFVEMRKAATGDEFMKKNIEQLANIYMLGMTVQEKTIQDDIAVGLSFDIKNEDAIAWAETRVGELIKWVDETTQKEIQSIIESAFTNGKSMNEIKDEIFAKFIQYSEYRASLIAVMETGNAYQQGKKAQFWRYQEKFGVVGFKRSKTQGDSNVRPTHIQNQLAWWIPANQNFPWTWTDDAPHGFNCRCNVTYSIYDQSRPIWGL